MGEFWIWKKIFWCSLLPMLASVIVVVIFINIFHLLFISGIPYMQVWPRPKQAFRQWRLIATFQTIHWFLFISENWGNCAGKVTSVRSLQHLNHFMVSNEIVYVRSMSKVLWIWFWFHLVYWKPLIYLWTLFYTYFIKRTDKTKIYSNKFTLYEVTYVSSCQ